MIWGYVCQKQVWRATKSNYTPLYLRDAITYPSLWYLLLVHKSSYAVLANRAWSARVSEKHVIDVGNGGGSIVMICVDLFHDWIFYEIEHYSMFSFIESLLKHKYVCRNHKTYLPSARIHAIIHCWAATNKCSYFLQWPRSPDNCIQLSIITIIIL